MNKYRLSIRVVSIVGIATAILGIIEGIWAMYIVLAFFLFTFYISFKITDTL